MPLTAKLSFRPSHTVTLSALSLILMTLSGTVFAQPGLNIAGNYRGIITRCLVAAQPNVCRAAVTELVQLAVDVDMKRADWEADETRGDAASAKANHAEYAVALEKLNSSVIDFNRDIAGPRNIH